MYCIKIRKVEETMLSFVGRYIEDTMILVPSGVEMMRDFHDTQKWISSNSKMSIPGRKGSLNEVKQEININAFYLSKFPVTTDVYHFVMSKNLAFSDKGIPVVNVSWYDALKFCNLVSLEMGLNPCYQFGAYEEEVVCDWTQNGYRLPTDAEWQYACRASSKGYRYGELDKIAWYEENSQSRIHKVGGKQANQWGLYDMLGNVWEWCWDLYDEERYGSYRIFRGGSWAEESRGCGATCRRCSSALFKIEDLGFRLARSKN